MKVTNRSDFPVTDDSCKEATGKTFRQWFKELDKIDGLTQGRRASTQYIYAHKADPWWPTTIYVEYEAHHDVKKKDGLAEGYNICATKTINAPVDEVYKTWADPKKFAAMFDDEGKQTVEEGGAISCRGGCQGRIIRIRPNKDLRFTWEHKGCTAPMRVDVQFQNNKDKCLMYVMTSRILTRPEADGLRKAWAETLTRLKSLCES